MKGPSPTFFSHLVQVHEFSGLAEGLYQAKRQAARAHNRYALSRKKGRWGIEHFLSPPVMLSFETHHARGRSLIINPYLPDFSCTNAVLLKSQIAIPPPNSEPRPQKISHNMHNMEDAIEMNTRGSPSARDTYSRSKSDVERNGTVTNRRGRPDEMNVRNHKSSNIFIS